MPSRTGTGTGFEELQKFTAALCHLLPILLIFTAIGFGQETIFREALDAQHDTSPPLRDLVDPGHIAQFASLMPRDRSISNLVSIPLNMSTGLALVKSFAGIATPPGTTSQWATDATGAAGPNHYVQAVNFSAAIYDRNGNLIMGPFATSQFWSGFSGPCGGTWSDVIVLYDHAAQRWFVSRFSRQNNVSPLNWYQCFAISQTSDPTGSYNRYAFLIDADEFNDYPKFGIWPDAYYMTADRDKIFPGKGNFVAAFERGKMLAGQAAGSVVFKIDNNGKRAGMLPADWDGPTPPPPGAPNYLVRTLDTNLGWPAAALEVWRLQVDWANSAFNLALLTTLAPDAFNSALCGLNQNCIPQPGTAQGLDPLAGGRPMMRLAYRNFGTHEAMVFNQTVDAADVPNHAGVRWYELRKSGGGPWSIFQQNTLAPDADHRWIGSVAMDHAGNMALGYNVSGAVFPSLRVAARLATDGAGVMTEELTLKAGSGSQTGFLFWADYSHMAVDPLDDCTLWYVGPYQPVTSDQQSWATQISALRFPSCTADLAITKTRAPAGPVDAGTNVTYTVTLTNNGPNSSGNVTVTDAVPPGTGFVSLIAPPGWSCTTPAAGAAGQITCKKPIVSIGEIAQFTVVAKINCNVPNGTMIGNTASVASETPPDPVPGNNSQSVSLTVNNPVPVVTASVMLSQLPQNNHNLVNVGLSAMATDGACPAPTTFSVQVFSDEDDQDPNDFSPDAKDIGIGTLRLREERDAQGDGRVYLIVVKATDTAGGTGFDTATVVVPKSSSPANQSSVDAQALSAKTFAGANNGAAPAGFSVVGDGPVVGPKQ